MNVPTHHVAVAVPADKLAALCDAMNECPHHLRKTSDLLRLIAHAIHEVPCTDTDIWDWAGVAELCAIGLDKINDVHGDLLIDMSSKVRDAIELEEYQPKMKGEAQ